MNFRTVLIVINIAALAIIAGVVLYRVLSLRKNVEPTPANLEPYLGDSDLENRRLERALGWSLVFVLITALALPLYFLVEPSRQVKAEDGFLERSVERGAVLYANSQMPTYDSTKSLLCANCHGAQGEGGAAPFVLQPESDLCLVEQNKGNADVPQCLPQQVSWTAPAVNSVLQRYSRGEIKHILNYGRPGSPMPAWGIKSGKGVLNSQSIGDLVNYLASIQIADSEIKAISTEAVGEYRDGAGEVVTNAQDSLASAKQDLAEAPASSSASQLASLQVSVTTATAQLAAAEAYAAEVGGLSEGAILFRLNCARCHTKGWAYYDPTNLKVPAPSPQGSGAYGPSLRDGATKIQFPGLAGEQGQFDWVAVGVPANEAYGIRGISSGRMPHFAGMLSEAQIKAIVAYERNL